ncbi:MAG: hypothetical protein M1536_09015 [Firmicutes bacterium]|nr:hypothetical protein [Bacillota bacterium]
MKKSAVLVFLVFPVMLFFAAGSTYSNGRHNAPPPMPELFQRLQENV